MLTNPAMYSTKPVPIGRPSSALAPAPTTSTVLGLNIGPRLRGEVGHGKAPLSWRPSRLERCVPTFARGNQHVAEQDAAPARLAVGIQHLDDDVGARHG